MAQSFTTDTLVASVKRRAMIPENQSTFTKQDFIDLANEEMLLSLVPEVMRLHEDFFLITDKVALQDGVSSYRIPERAIGNKLRDVAFEDNNGNIYEMTRMSIDHISENNGPYTQNRIYAYHVEANTIVLQPNIQGSIDGFLRFSYYLRPNSIVTEDRIGTITAIDTDTGEITMDDTPSVFTTIKKYDFIDSRSPHVTLAKEIIPSAINATTNVITFDADDLPSDLAVGDYVCLKEETIVPQLPSDMHVYLAHRVAMRCMEAIGDAQGLQLASAKANEMADKLTNVIDNRVEAAPQKVVNRHGALRSGLYRRRYKYRG